MKGEFNEIDMFYIEELNDNHVYKREKKNWFAVSMIVLLGIVIGVALIDMQFHTYVNYILN